MENNEQKHTYTQHTRIKKMGNPTLIFFQKKNEIRAGRQVNVSCMQKKLAFGNK